MVFAAAETPSESYDAAYFRKWGDPGDALAAMKRRTYRQILHDARVRPPAFRTVLDVGCAFGWSLDAAREIGLEAAGVELSDHAARVAGRRHDVRRGVSEFESSSFDAVTMVDVLEHVRDPVSFLVEVRRVLRPGGVLALTTPDFSSLSARVLGARWPHLHAEHVVYFDRSTIRRALRKAGFVPHRVGPFRKWLHTRYLASLLRERQGWARIASMLVEAMTPPIELGWWSGDLFAVAERKESA